MRSTVHRPREPRQVRLAREAHVNVLVAANRFSDEMERRCRVDGISHAQYVALWVLCLSDDADDGLPMRALADGLLNRASDTTRLVDRLVDAGLAERFPSPGDRRLVLVRATAAGRDAFARVTRRVREFHRAQWAALSEAELTQLGDLLAKALWGATDVDEARGQHAAAGGGERS
ncbi:MAG TPA: MarR family transcriptional regulator [Acidimicrobiales bacterium]|jgi:DNA-binding MarR family transcriptional regulator|nr:MarR family transcriptional regulator [Acidimicrobiales bacterium]